MADGHARAQEFAGRLREGFGERLISVVLYGSAARGDYREGTSNINLLVIVRKADAATLRLGTALACEWAEAGNPPPLILGEAEWRDSADVFAIEYSDMKDANVVLHGGDPFEGINIEWADLRHQCEHELKAKQIQLRQHYILAADRPEEVGNLLKRSFPTFLTLFRTALRLAGESVPRPPREVVDAAAATIGFDAAPFRAVIGARESDGAFAPPGDGEVAMGYLSGVGKATAWIDGLTTPGSGE